MRRSEVAVEPHKGVFKMIGMHENEIMQSEQNINEIFINLTKEKSIDGVTQRVAPLGALSVPYAVQPQVRSKWSSPVSGDCRIGRDRTGNKYIGRFINSYLSISMHGVPIVFVNPKGTSRTCSKCGAKGVVKGRIFVCKKCGLKLDRDLNASRNIALRAPPRLKRRGFRTGVML